MVSGSESCSDLLAEPSVLSPNTPGALAAVVFNAPSEKTCDGAAIAPKSMGKATSSESDALLTEAPMTPTVASKLAKVEVALAMMREPSVFVPSFSVNYTISLGAPPIFDQSISIFAPK